MGLAAPQIGRSERVFYCACGTLEGTFVIDPRINSVSEECDVGEEGCLSIPGIILMTTRNREIQVGYTDIFGNRTTTTLTGISARIFQHELDHLDGKLFIDSLSREERLLIATELSKRPR